MWWNKDGHRNVVYYVYFAVNDTAEIGLHAYRRSRNSQYLDFKFGEQKDL